MFDFQPINTSNLFTLLQASIVLVGFIFAWKSLSAAQGSLDVAAQNLGVATGSLNTAAQNLQVATANAQVQLYNQIIVQGRDLQFKFMDLYLQDDIKAKQEQFLGTILAYYSACFELGRVFTLPDSVTRLIDNELRELLREDAVRRKFDQLKHMYSREFNGYVNGLYGV